MTLGVNVIDKFLNKSLNENGKKYGVLIDDTIDTIKDVIFTNTTDFFNETLSYYPNFLKIEILEQDTDTTPFQTIRTNNNLFFFYKTLPKKPEIYITSISNIIGQDTYETTAKETNVVYKLDAYDLYNKMKADDEMINSLYDDLVEDFVNLKMEDLYIMIKMKFYNFNSNLDVSIISSDENDDLLNEIQEFFEKVRNLKRLTESKESKDLLEFYKQVYSYKSKRYYESIDNYPAFNFTKIKLTMKNNDYDEGVDGRFIKLQQVFNLFELSNKIPIIIFNDSFRRDPKIKVYNKLGNDLSENAIKSWILNEKKKIKKVSYKKVRGLMLKYLLQDIQTIKPQNNYVTVLINENGLINVKVDFDEEDNQASIERITDNVKRGLDDMIESLNNLHGVFTKSKRLQDTSNSSIVISSMNAVLETSKKIKKSKFEKMLTRFEGSRIFESKDIKNDMISMYYKRYGKRTAEEGEYSERLGITVNIQDNPYQLNSSTITIYDGFNLSQLKIIVDEIFILSELSTGLKTNIFEESDEEEEQIIKERTQNVKLLRQLGAKTSSTKCQKQRQPKIDNETNIDNPELVITYGGNKYICDNEQYKYPGLTAGEIPCCFKKPGKGFEGLISSKIMEIKVQPSNFTVDIKTGSLPIFTTYVIKVTSEYIPNIDLSKSRYFYYDNSIPDFPLVHIHNDRLIEAIESNEKNERDESIWLAEVPLLQITTSPNKNTCLNLPHLHNKKNDDLNSPCQHHDVNKFFGYNANSYPCCFEKPQVAYKPKRKEKGVVKQHIFTTDKLLGYKRLGILQPGLNKLLNEIIKIDVGAFLRWGVNQNRYSFLNCIVESINDSKIDSAYELKRFLINYLERHSDIFVRLNNGNISLKYETMKNYISEIDSEAGIHWTNIIDLIQHALMCNIMVIDIPYTETLSKVKYDYSQMKLMCNFNSTYDVSKPFLFLIKKQNAFEILVSNSSAEWNPKSEKMVINEKRMPIINFLFNYNDVSTKLVNFFLDYYNSTCIKQTRFPDKYPYDELYEFSYVINVLANTSDPIAYQIKNAFNKIDYLVTKRGFIIPIKETGIDDTLKVFSFYDFITKNKAIGIERFIEYLNIFNSTPIEPKMKLLGITTQQTQEVNQITGTLTNFGQIIPVKNTEIPDNVSLPILSIKYYYDVDQYLSNTLTTPRNEQDWNGRLNNFKLKIYNVKKLLGDHIFNNNYNKTLILEITRDPNDNRLKKIKSIASILRGLLEEDRDGLNLTEEDLDFILDHISNEIINDNIENQLMNNIITSDIFDPNEIVKKSSESVWLNLNDINKWFKKFSENNDSGQ